MLETYSLNPHQKNPWNPWCLWLKKKSLFHNHPNQLLGADAKKKSGTMLIRNLTDKTPEGQQWALLFFWGIREITKMHLLVFGPSELRFPFPAIREKKKIGRWPLLGRGGLESVCQIKKSAAKPKNAQLTMRRRTIEPSEGEREGLEPELYGD